MNDSDTTQIRFKGDKAGRRGGFTLIELLVVVAIMALLMGILIPALSKVRSQAKAVICQSNLRQWGLIWSVYCNDNNGNFSSGVGVGWARGQWIVCLRPQYQTKSDILRCPMAMKTLGEGFEQGGPFNAYQMPIGDGETSSSSQTVKLLYHPPDDEEQPEPEPEPGGEKPSYGANCWLYNPPADVNEIQGRPTKWNWRTMFVKGGSEIPVFGDSMWRGGGPYEQGIGGDPPAFNGQWLGVDHEMAHFCIDRHRGYVNHLFLDWSVRKVGLKELWTLKWHRKFNTAGRWTSEGGCTPDDWPEWMRKFKD